MVSLRTVCVVTHSKLSVTKKSSWIIFWKAQLQNLATDSPPFSITRSGLVNNFVSPLSLLIPLYYTLQAPFSTGKIRAAPAWYFTNMLHCDMKYFQFKKMHAEVFEKRSAWLSIDRKSTRRFDSQSRGQILRLVAINNTTSLLRCKSAVNNCYNVGCTRTLLHHHINAYSTKYSP